MAPGGGGGGKRIDLGGLDATGQLTLILLVILLLLLVVLVVLVLVVLVLLVPVVLVIVVVVVVVVVVIVVVVVVVVVVALAFNGVCAAVPVQGLIEKDDEGQKETTQQANHLVERSRLPAPTAGRTQVDGNLSSEHRLKRENTATTSRLAAGTINSHADRGTNAIPGARDPAESVRVRSA